MIEIDQMDDERGFFARLWCRDEFKAQGIEMDVAQASLSHNPLRGTLRGLHFQWPPSREAKLVRCERGCIYDAIIDLRPESSSFGQHFAIELNSRRRNALYVPSGFAHGFQTLEADSDVVYMMSDVFRPTLADGVRFDDPAFGIAWPLPVSCMIDRDRGYPDFDRAAYVKKYREAVQPS